MTTTTGSTAKPQTRTRTRTRTRTPEQWAAFAAEYAPQLRAVGVLQLELEGATFVLAPAVAVEPDYPSDTSDQAQPEPADPFDDPHTYGLGGRVPAFPRDNRNEDDGE